MSESKSLPVVWLPGLMCDQTVWPDQVREFGGTVADYGSLDSLPKMAAHVLATAPKEFAVAGHSMGGRVALEVYRAARGRVKALALLDTGYTALASGEAGVKEVDGRMALLEIARAKGTRAMAKEWVKGMVHPSRLKDRALIDAILDMMGRKSAEIFEAQQGALIARPEAGPLLAEIDCPTLVLCGREDSWSPPARHEEMARAIRGSTLAIIENCGHMCTMEQPQEINRHLAAWLAKTGVRPQF
jgi:pimeloyl-ACP methyl ester carboxylesterase